MSSFLSATPNYFLTYRAIHTQTALGVNSRCVPVKDQFTIFSPVLMRCFLLQLPWLYLLKKWSCVVGYLNLQLGSSFVAVNMENSAIAR